MANNEFANFYLKVFRQLESRMWLRSPRLDPDDFWILDDERSDFVPIAAF
jgi:hypothetical protein